MDPAPADAVTPDAGAVSKEQLVEYLRELVPGTIGGSEGELVAVLSESSIESRLTQ